MKDSIYYVIKNCCKSLFLTLYIYYNIFFIKNQTDFLTGFADRLIEKRRLTIS